MNKYAAFSARYNGPIKLLGQDLGHNHFFIIQEGRYAYYEKGKLYFEGQPRPMEMYRVWNGSWPKGTYDVKEVVKLIEGKRYEPRQQKKKFYAHA